MSTFRGILSPSRQLRRAAIIPDGSRALLTINVALASILLTLQSVGTIAAMIVAFWPIALLPSPAVALGPTWQPTALTLVFLLWFLLISMLTRIERIGIHFYSRRRSWRIDPVLSLVGTAHASGAWIGAALLARLLPFALEAAANSLPAAIAIHLAGIRLMAAPLGFIAGMIGFELATFFGLRACRYGNHPRVRIPSA